MYNILICDDERDIVSALKIYLTAEGYTVFEAYDGNQALEVLACQEIHLLLLDVMMPGLDGLQVVSRLRERWNIPVILLTAKSEDADKILGLNLGADDYVTKPFHPAELLARVRSQLRRYMLLGSGTTRTAVLRIGGVELDDETKLVSVDGEAVTLTPKEYDILRFLMSHPGRVFSPGEIYRQVWHELPLNSENAVAVHIRHIREKIEIDPADPQYLKVVWGKGYKMEAGNHETPEG